MLPGLFSRSLWAVSGEERALPRQSGVQERGSGVGGSPEVQACLPQQRDGELSRLPGGGAGQS